MKDIAIKEFLEALDDPKGKHQRAARRSFPKSQAAQEELANEIGAKYGIDPQVLHDAEVSRRAEILLRGWSLFYEKI